MSSRKAEVLMSLKDSITNRLKSIKSSFKKTGVTGKAAMLGISVATKTARMSLRGLGNTATWATRKMKTLAMTGAVTLAGAFALATKKAMTQEAAEIELAAALDLVGAKTRKILPEWKAWASSMQEQTVYGDEFILGLMRQALTLGISTEKVKEATKASMALSSLSNRLKPEIALRYYNDALNGTVSSLASYNAQLRNAKNKQQQQILLQEMVARGWDAQTAKVKSAEGSWKQTFNTIGDSMEAFATPFLSSFAQSANTIKTWCDSNKARIANWGETTKNIIINWKNSAIVHFENVRDSIIQIYQEGRIEQVWQKVLERMSYMSLKAAVAIAKSMGSVATLFMHDNKIHQIAISQLESEGNVIEKYPVVGTDKIMAFGRNSQLVKDREREIKIQAISRDIAEQIGSLNQDLDGIKSVIGSESVKSSKDLEREIFQRNYESYSKDYPAVKELNITFTADQKAKQIMDILGLNVVTKVRDQFASARQKMDIQLGQ